MKTIKEQVSLIGRIETISMSDFRSKPGSVFTQVELGKTFLVTKGKQIIAVVQAPPGNALLTVVDKWGEKTYRL